MPDCENIPSLMDSSTIDVDGFLEDWNKFLREALAVNLPSQKTLMIPVKCPGFNWGIVAPKGITIEQVVDSYRDICPIWR